MSPASRSKSKDKKPGKESQNAPVKLPGATNGGGSGVPASAYNPLLGTFHTLDAVPEYSAPSSLHVNSRFQNIDDTDDHSGTSLGTGPECDSVSNNGSWSGESEDHKEKAPNTAAIRQEAIPGAADNDKREKIRQKNERKHRRQKERRAHELHERCNGYLMSRKLEALSQQLVAMGFSAERATMALILNEGRVEESVTWLFEGHEEGDKHKDQNNGNGSNNLKIDISEELARIADMEIRYKCSKQEVERVIVSCEGDLDKATETLRAQIHDRSSTPQENGDPPKVSDGRVLVAAAAATPNNMVRLPQKVDSSTSMQQQKGDELNYGKTAATVNSSPSDLVSKNGITFKNSRLKLDSARPQQIASLPEKRWAGGGSNASVSSYHPSTSPLQESALPPPPKLGTIHFNAVRNEAKNHHLGTVREPVIMMQRPKSFNGTEQAPTTTTTTTTNMAATTTSLISSSSPRTANSGHPNGVEIMKTVGNGVPMRHMPSNTTRSVSPNSLRLNQLYLQNHHHQHQPFIPSDRRGHYVDFAGTNNKGSVSWSKTGTSSTVAAASSLGLFSGFGSAGGGGGGFSSGSSSSMDWNATGGSAKNLDYSSIDWSLDRGMSSSSSSNLSPLWMGSIPEMSPQIYESDVYGRVRSKPATTITRLTSKSNGISIPGSQGGGREAPVETLTSPEWTSPFEGQDLFSLPRQFVSYPSL